jgi:hypothetical protein
LKVTKALRVVKRDGASWSMTTRDTELHEEKPEIEAFVILRVIRGSRFEVA